MLSRRKCPVCGCEGVELIKNIPINISAEMRREVNYPQSYDIVCCNKCGMIFADSSLSKEDVDAYYVHCNMYDNMGNVKTDIQNEACELYFNAISPYLTPQSKVIDVGCGEGVFLKFLKDKGYSNLYGLDPSESSIKNCKKAGIKGIVGSVYDEIPDELWGNFDIVVCTYVFEHLLIPDICLGNLVNLLNERGILYITVPNAEGFGEYLCEVPNYFNQEHINYFTTKTLDYFCSKKGLFRCSSDEDCHYVMTSTTPEMNISAVYRLSSLRKEIDLPDEDGKKSIIKYFDLIHHRQERNRNDIEKLLVENREIIIWGTGGLSASLLASIPGLLDRVKCFVDNDVNKCATTYWGKQVIAPNELKLYPDTTIMICIMMNRDSVIKQVKEMQITNELFLLS